mmetsp:Transcript_24970/g.25349  ORF Transcript_24970/g.25349 Transcript_24970/m.25349 type:complete len:115 (-) Transcript_24970:893-1237(-)
MESPNSFDMEISAVSVSAPSSIDRTEREFVPGKIDSIRTVIRFCTCDVIYIYSWCRRRLSEAMIANSVQYYYRLPLDQSCQFMMRPIILICITNKNETRPRRRHNNTRTRPSTY